MLASERERGFAASATFSAPLREPPYKPSATAIQYVSPANMYASANR
jgi:hypothetical protein